ncbi:MAG: hypothetical protein ABUS57_19585, partial [Pseudomonadota bacterium]
MPDLELDAFISYRRSDGTKAARWLRRAIEGFKAPRKLREAYGRRLTAYLDSAYERGASDFYAQNIRPALLAARHLIVVATPDAIKRSRGEDWIQREVEDFAMARDGASVFVVRAKGDLSDPLPADIATRFPNVEIVDLRDLGAFWFLNPLRASRITNEKLKIIATLTGVPIADIPLLRQEEEHRQQTRLGATVGAALGVAVLVSSLSLYALDSQRRAQKTLDDALFTVGRVIETAAGSGDSEESKSYVLNESCDLMDKLRVQTGANVNQRPAVACLIERAGGREKVGEKAEAEQALASAVALAMTAYNAAPGQENATTLLRARGAAAAYYARAKNAQAQAQALTALIADARRLGKAYPLAAIDEEEALAHEQLATMAAARSDQKGAVAELAEAAKSAMNAASRQTAEPQAQARNRAWAGQMNMRAAQAAEAANDGAAALAAASAAMDSFAAITPELSAHIEADIDAAAAQAMAYLLRRRAGLPEAEAALRAGRATLARIKRSELSSDDQARLDRISAALSSAPS